MPENKQLEEKLQEVRENGGGVVLYRFEDGGKKRAPINKQIFVNEKGRQKTNTEVLKVFEQTMYDLKAISFEI